MIITNIVGGLGNQMFQYACGRALSLYTEQPLRIATDQFNGYELHNGFELQRVFNVDVIQASEIELKRLLGWQSSPMLRRILGRPIMHWATSNCWAAEPYFHYWSGIKNVRMPAYLHGYWQSERYFSNAEECIRKDFEFRMPWDEDDLNLRERMHAQPSVSIHVRRGDYATSSNKNIYAQCGIDYYRNAIRLIQQKVPDVKIFAFSDDPDWVEANLEREFDTIETVRHNIGHRSAHDMRLMSQADHHIIANSTFSWWAAWLNPSPDKIVVAPSRWFTNGTDDRDLIPSSWIRK
jgi:hypothetical protein